jgi:hypothetical protein
MTHNRYGPPRQAAPKLILRRGGMRLAITVTPAKRSPRAASAIAPGRDARGRYANGGNGADRPSMFGSADAFLNETRGGAASGNNR